MDLPIDENGNLECTICSEAIGIPRSDDGKTESPVELPCGHTFGNDCIHQWRLTNNICPNCRAPCPEEEQYRPAPVPRRPGLGLRRRGEDGPLFRSESRALMEGERGGSGSRLVQRIRNLRGEVTGSCFEQAPSRDAVAGHEFDREYQMSLNPGAGPPGTWVRGQPSNEAYFTHHQEAMILLPAGPAPIREGVTFIDGQPFSNGRPLDNGFQASTAASRNRRSANTTTLAAYASNPNLRRARGEAVMSAARSSNPNLRHEHYLRTVSDLDLARRRLDGIVDLENDAAGAAAARRLGAATSIMDEATLRPRHSGSRFNRATSMGDLGAESMRRTTQCSSNLNPARGNRQTGRNLLRTMPEEEDIMDDVQDTVNRRRPAGEISRGDALHSSNPELQARWMHQQSISELHELMILQSELEGSGRRAFQVRSAMAEIIQRRRQERQSFMAELDRNDMNFAADVGPRLRILNGEDSSQITRLITIRRETQETMAEAERPMRSPTVREQWERLGGRRRS